jgi:hypothetical protein
MIILLPEAMSVTASRWLVKTLVSFQGSQSQDAALLDCGVS